MVKQIVTMSAVGSALAQSGNPLLQQLNNMQFPQGGLPQQQQMPFQQQQMDPNMAAMLYQQQLLQAQQQQQQNQGLSPEAIQAFQELAQQNELLQKQQEQLLQYINTQHQEMDMANNVLTEQQDQLWMAQNPGMLHPESVDRALCLSASGVAGNVWSNMRERLNNVLSKSVGLLPIDQAQKLLDNVLQQFTAAGSDADSCGMGVLSLHLMNALCMERNNETDVAMMYLFNQFQPLSDPILTLTLDLPWEAVMNSKWPLFPLLSQVHHRKTEVMDLEEINGFNHTATHKFYNELSGHVGRRSWDDVRVSSEKFLDKYMLDTSHMAMLTAFVGQGMNTNSSFRDGIMLYTQDQFKKMVGSGADMDAVLGSAWPFFEMLQGLWDSNENRVD